MKIVGIDFKQLERCTGRYDYILIIKDHFTYYTQAFPTCNKSSKTNTKKPFTDFILHFGCPEKILLDQGKEFRREDIFDHHSDAEVVITKLQE